MYSSGSIDPARGEGAGGSEGTSTGAGYPGGGARFWLPGIECYRNPAPPRRARQRGGVFVQQPGSHTYKSRRGSREAGRLTMSLPGTKPEAHPEPSRAPRLARGARRGPRCSWRVQWGAPGPRRTRRAARIAGGDPTQHATEPVGAPGGHRENFTYTLTLAVRCSVGPRPTREPPANGRLYRIPKQPPFVGLFSGVTPYAQTGARPRQGANNERPLRIR